MELYKTLAEKCQIEENSSVYVPDEALRMFVRLVIRNDAKENFAIAGYTSGLFDGTGSVNYCSVEKFHEEISKEVQKLKSEGKMFGIHEHFGVDIKYVQKENFVRKSSFKNS